VVRRVAEDTIVVIGLGRFGAELATTLMGLGQEVLAIERDPDLVARLAPLVTLAVEGDGTRVDTLRSLGVGEVHTVVVAIGTSLEASLLATSAASELGVPNIWSKAVSHEHQRILKRVGATHVVFPELDMGRRVGHQLVQGGASDYIEFSSGYAIAIRKVPAFQVGRTLAQTKLLATHRVLCIAVQNAGREDFRVADSATVLQATDVMVVAGQTMHVENFAVQKGVEPAD
jgi:trk system potassium uptake protein